MGPGFGEAVAARMVAALLIAAGVLFMAGIPVGILIAKLMGL